MLKFEKYIMFTLDILLAIHELKGLAYNAKILAKISYRVLYQNKTIRDL